jgi:hypothetical protein
MDRKQEQVVKFPTRGCDKFLPGFADSVVMVLQRKQMNVPLTAKFAKQPPALLLLQSGWWLLCT